MSAPKVQEAAAKAHGDQVRLLEGVGKSGSSASSSLRELSQLGAAGRYAGNIGVELKQWLGDASTPRPMSVNVLVRVTKPRSSRAAVQHVQLPYLAPHVLFSTWFHEDIRSFENKMRFFPETYDTELRFAV